MNLKSQLTLKHFSVLEGAKDIVSPLFMGSFDYILKLCLLPDIPGKCWYSFCSYVSVSLFFFKAH